MGFLYIVFPVLVLYLSRFLVEISSHNVVHSSPTEFKDDGFDVIFPKANDPQYENCKKSLNFTDCSNFTNYPRDFMKSLVRRNESGLFTWCQNKPFNNARTETKTQTPTTTILPRSSKKYLCDVKKSIAKPKGLVINETFYYVIQVETENMTCYQEFGVEVCMETAINGAQSEQKCHDGYGDLSFNEFELKPYEFGCKEEWTYYTDLIVLNEKKEVTKVRPKIPCCCTCQFKKKK